MIDAQPADAPSPPGSPDAVERPCGEAPHGTAAFLDAVLRALSDGPRTPHGIDRAIDAEWPGFLEGRRGYVHPALLELRRAGRVREAGPGADGVMRYAAAGVADDDAATHAPGGVTPLGPDQERLARRVTRGLAFAPALQRAVTLDVAAHLNAIEAEDDSPGGRRATSREFGDPWRIAKDLRRTALGRRTVLFPAGLKEALAGLMIYDAGILLAIVGAIVFVRLQVFTAYHIPTRSMEPTLHGDKNDGDRILVNRLVGAPDRFDIWVFDGWGSERKNYVKRCGGLPNERLKIREGDLYVNGDLVRKDGATLEALLQPLWTWDDVHARLRTAELEGDAYVDAFYDEHFDTWEKVSGTWLLDMAHGYSAEAPATGADAVLRWAEPLQNDLYDPATGDRDEGYHDCPDVRVTADVELLDARTRVTLRLTRGASTFEARLGRDGVTVLADGEIVAESDDVALEPGVPAEVRFSQVDRVLRLEVDGRLLRHDLAQPDLPRLNAPSAILGFRVTEGGARILPTRLERDVYYTPDYENDEVVLGPHDYFMLGDNSENSHDSRRNGAVHRARLVGEPVLIVWPPARWRVPR